MMKTTHRTLLLSLLTGALAACSSAPPLQPSAALASGPAKAEETGVLAPNANLVVQGIPPVPTSLVKSVARYTEFSGHGFLDWHPSQREMLISFRKPGRNTTQLYRLTSPMAEPEALTDLPDPVSNGSYEPRDGRFIVFSRSSGGNEADQLYRLDVDTRVITLLTDPTERHEFNVWLHGRSLPNQERPPARFLSASVPLDRTAQQGSRASINTRLWLTDPLQPESRRLVAELPGGGWSVSAVSADDTQLALNHSISANESEIWLMNLASGERRQLLPAANRAADAPMAVYQPEAFQEDGRGLLITSDQAGEFRELMRLDLASGALSRLTRHIPWDVDLGSAAEDGSLLALRSNEDGLGRLRLFDGKTLAELPARELPEGTVGGLGFHRASRELALVLNNRTGPGQIYSLNPGTGTVQQWTRAHAAPGVDTSRFARQEIIRWNSFDGLGISGLITRASPQRYPGKRPVLVSIHGGPEGQAGFGFIGRANYLVEELGVSIIQPNVRGSSGYGKKFLALDNGYKREDSVKDIGALLDWIATQPDLDASRVLVTGGSYGGYMSLAVATHYADRIAGNIDIVGISNFVTFLTNTESYRRDLRRVEYGDERDPAMRAFLQEISPLTHVERIRKPMFVVQGLNDPRVPYTESEQMVAKARANGVSVWYLRAENEGHGFRRKENADFEFFSTVLFMQQTLLK